MSDKSSSPVAPTYPTADPAFQRGARYYATLPQHTYRSMKLTGGDLKALCFLQDFSRGTGITYATYETICRGHGDADPEYTPEGLRTAVKRLAKKNVLWLGHFQGPTRRHLIVLYWDVIPALQSLQEAELPRELITRKQQLAAAGELYCWHEQRFTEAQENALREFPEIQTGTTKGHSEPVSSKEHTTTGQFDPISKGQSDPMSPYYCYHEKKTKKESSSPISPPPKVPPGTSQKFEEEEEYNIYKEKVAGQNQARCKALEAYLSEFRARYGPIRSRAAVAADAIAKGHLDLDVNATGEKINPHVSNGDVEANRESALKAQVHYEKLSAENGHLDSQLVRSIKADKHSVGISFQAGKKTVYRPIAYAMDRERFRNEMKISLMEGGWLK